MTRFVPLNVNVGETLSPTLLCGTMSWKFEKMIDCVIHVVRACARACGGDIQKENHL